MFMGRRIFLVILFITIVYLTGCQSVPDELIHKHISPYKNDIDIFDTGDDISYDFPLYEGGMSASPAMDKKSEKLIPHIKEQIKKTIKIGDAGIIIDAVASIPEVNSLPLLEVEYIPPIDDNLLNALISNLYENPSNAQPLSGEETNFYPKQYQVYKGERKRITYTTDEFRFFFNYDESQNIGLESISADQATEIVTKQINNILQDVDIWPEPANIYSDGSDFYIEYMQSVWGMPIAFGRSNVNGIFIDDTYLIGTIALKEYVAPEFGNDNGITYKTGDITCLGIIKPIHVLSIYENNCKIQSLDKVLEYISSETNAYKLIAAADIGVLSKIRMVYVPEKNRSVQSGLILKPYWEFSLNDSHNNVHVYRYSALTEDYE